MKTKKTNKTLKLKKVAKKRVTNKAALVRKYLAKGFAPADVAKKAKVAVNYVYQTRWHEKQKEAKAKPAKHAEAAGIARVLSITTDLVNRPPHYTNGGIEVIDFIEAKGLDYQLGNVVKYISRAGKKGADIDEDLAKAQWYLNREIAKRQSALGKT